MSLASVFCVVDIPRGHLRGRRRTPRTVGRRPGDGTWPEDGAAFASVPMLNRGRDEARSAQIHHNRQHGYRVGASGKVASAVFFTGEGRVIRFFPRLRPLEFDTFFMQNGAQSLDTDRFYNLHLHNVLS